MELSLPLNYAGSPREARDQVAALEPAGLDTISGGRAPLGIGGSGAQVVEGRHGKAYAKLLGRTHETVRDRIEAFRESRVTPLDVIPVGPDPARLISTVKNWL